MKGILLVGGTGTRLHPVTSVVNKHLLPIYDKPMAYYPLSTLMMAGIRDILVVGTPQDLPLYRELFRSAGDLGLRLSYAEQPRPEGIAQALIIAREFIGSDDVTLILGDNVFYGHDLGGLVTDAIAKNRGATVFAYYVKDPERYGVVEFDAAGNIVGLEEKPKQPRSPYAVTGLYVYDNDVVRIAQQVKPSARGELEITAVNRAYLDEGRLRAVLLGRGIAWLDTGTHGALVDASSFVATIERRQGLRVACLEEVAYRMGFIGLEQLAALAKSARTEADRLYLDRIVAETSRGMVRSGTRTE